MNLITAVAAMVVFTACDSGSSGGVDIVVVYGSDNPERLDQLDAGSYSTEVRFVDDTNDREVTRTVNLTVM